MKIRTLTFIALVGIILGIISVFVYNEKAKPLPPVASSYNPYITGVYATGIVESFQPNGSNINIFPEVSGKVVQIFVHEGEVVKKNDKLLALDDSVQRQVVEKDDAQIRYALENLASVEAQWQKMHKAYLLNRESVSQEALDNAKYAVKIAQESLNVAKSTDAADKALLDKYMLKSSCDGSILRIACSSGSYVSPSGSYDVYTQGYLPPVQMGVMTPYLQVRAYVDEILVPQLPSGNHLEATLFVRGMNNKSIPLEFISIQPLTIPNIELSNQVNQKVDVRVLPIIFKFAKPKEINIFPGQLVDVYIKTKK